jgi:hypothetical protein
MLSEASGPVKQPGRQGRVGTVAEAYEQTLPFSIS